MNPAGEQPTVKYEGFSEQPEGATVINISTEPPRDHIIWSLFSFVYANVFCLGLAALIFSVKARDRKLTGDLTSARHYASKARTLNIWAAVLASIFGLTFLVLFSLSFDIARNLNIHG